MSVVSVYFLYLKASFGLESFMVVLRRSVRRGGSLGYLSSVLEKRLVEKVMFIGFSLSILDKDGRFLTFLSI